MKDVGICTINQVLQIILLIVFLLECSFTKIKLGNDSSYKCGINIHAVRFNQWFKYYFEKSLELV